MNVNHPTLWDCLKTENGRRRLDCLVRPLMVLPGLQYAALGSLPAGGGACFIPRFRFLDRAHSDPFHIGVFACIHGDEPAGALAAAQLLMDLAGNPSLGENFSLNIYPVCNPTGFEDNTRTSRNGLDLNREFWKGSSQVEVQILENELRNGHFQGIIQLHADDTSDGVYGFVRGHTLTENLLRPALCEAGKVLPRNVNATIDGFAARDGIIHDHYEGVLAAPARIEPVPFEIILETPHHAELALQVNALVAAMKTILVEYRRMMAFAADI